MERQKGKSIKKKVVEDIMVKKFTKLVENINVQIKKSYRLCRIN